MSSFSIPLIRISIYMKMPHIREGWKRKLSSLISSLLWTMRKLMKRHVVIILTPFFSLLSGFSSTLQLESIGAIHKWKLICNSLTISLEGVVQSQQPKKKNLINFFFILILQTIRWLVERQQTLHWSYLNNIKVLTFFSHSMDSF